MKAELKVVSAGYMTAEQRYERFYGSKGKFRDTKISARRVDPVGDDHIQIDVTVTEYFESGATRTMHGAMRLEPEHFQAIAEYLSKPWDGLVR